MKWFSTVLVALFLSTAVACCNLPRSRENMIRQNTPSIRPVTPLILIPGDGGSQVFAKYNADDFLCPVSKDWFLIWVNLEFLIPLTEHCMRTYFKLNYNVTTRKTSNLPGLQTTVTNWGNTSSIEYLDTTHYSFLDYYGTLVKNLVTKMNYSRGIDVRGAPYDFRKAPNDNVDFVPMLKNLVEDTYYRNQNQRVMLTAHSMGNLYTLYFLKRMAPAWKKKFVRGFIAVSAPIGGAVKSVRAMTAGDSLSRVLLIGPVRDVLRSMPSTPFLFPSPHFWKKDELIAMRPSRNYTVANYHQLFQDMPFKVGWEMYKDVSVLFDPLWVPDVDELYCAHGIRKDTPLVLQWSFDFQFPTFQPDVKFGDGDGTVNIRSLMACTRWPLKKHMTYSGAEHVATLQHPQFIADMMRILAMPDKNARSKGSPTAQLV